MMYKTFTRILFVLFISMLISHQVYPQQGAINQGSNQQGAINQGTNQQGSIQQGANQNLSSWQIGVYGGFSQYYGDISHKSYFEKFSGETGLSFGMHFRRHFNENYGLGLSVSRAKLLSEKEFKADGITRFDLKYEGTLNHFSIHSYLNFSNFFWGYSERKLNLYGTLGLGYATWNGALYNTLNNSVVANFETASTNAAPTFPATIGFEYALTENLKLTFEGTLLTVFSDDVDYYLDGFLDRGSQYDIITQTHIGLSYFFRSGNRSRKTVQPSSRGIESSRWEPVMPISVIEYEVYPELPSEKKTKIELPPLTLTPVEEKVVQQKQTLGFEFRVQIYATGHRTNNSTSIYRNVQFEYPITENFFNGIYRYSTGSFASYADAEAYARQLQNRGVYDAFVVAYRNNERVSITSEMKR